MNVFNNGSKRPSRSLVQIGAVGLLHGLTRSQGGYLYKVEAWGGIVRAYTNEVDMEWVIKEMGSTPSIAVLTGTRNFESTNIQRTALRSEMELTLLFGSQHGRSLTARMLGDHQSKQDAKSDPGLDVVMAHALELMHGAYPDQMRNVIKQIQAVTEEELVTNPEVTIWSQTYRVVLHDHQPAPTYGTSRQFATPRTLLDSIGWRITSDPAEVNRPAAATSSTSVDVDSQIGDP